jgi:hypothetical protein
MMSIEHIGNIKSNEYEAATYIKSIFEKKIKENNVDAEILLISPLNVFGQRVKDIDIVLVCHFGQGFRVNTNFKVRDNDDNLPARIIKNSNLYINSLCVCIEVKDHEPKPEKVKINNTVAKVFTSGKWHNATEQSNQQKISLQKFLLDHINYTPFVSNLIWFRNVSADKLPSGTNNYLPSKFSLEDLIGKISIQNFAFMHQTNKYYLLSAFGREKNIEFNLMDNFKKIQDVLSKYKENLGSISRKTLERITTNLLKDQKYANFIGNKLIIINGRAGTGKTVKLLHIAHDLCKNQNKRCLILTYNTALVSDIRRTICLADIDSYNDDGGTVAVKTIHSFIREILIGLGIYETSKNEYLKSKKIDLMKQLETTAIDQKQFDRKLSKLLDDFFLEKYDDLKKELVEYLQKEIITKEDILKIKTEFPELAWDILLIDEGQDWPKDEQEILIKIFNSDNLIVADGIDQLVRSPKQAEWDLVENHYKPPGEKKSRRQKANLTRFQKILATELRIKWDIEPNSDLPGGKIIIQVGKYTRKLHDSLIKELYESKNREYEMLFLVPPNLVSTDKETKERFFKNKDEWESFGISLWDGTSRDIRTEYPTKVEQHRLLQYDSCRGLEGWTVVCNNLDDFYDYKLKTVESRTENDILLEMKSEDEKKEELVSYWLMIPLTRAIDTIVITLKNNDTPIAKLLKKVSEQCTDFVEWYD